MSIDQQDTGQNPQGSHPLAGQTVIVHPKSPINGLVDGAEYRVEDYWHIVSGTSWGVSQGNPAALQYAVRAGVGDLPTDDEVLYGKVDGLGYLVHVSEIEVPA